MRVYRISNHANLNGEGGLRVSARWHTRGHRIVYCAPNPATAILETLVHFEIEIDDFPTTYRLLTIEIPDNVSRESITRENLPLKWEQNVLATRKRGDAWLGEQDTALLIVPAAFVPDTVNTLINPVHVDSKSISIVQSAKYAFDKRLLK